MHVAEAQCGAYTFTLFALFCAMRSRGFQTRSLSGGSGSQNPKHVHKDTQREGLCKTERLFQTTATTIHRHWPRSKREWKQFLWRSAIGLFAFSILYIAFLWLTLPDINDPVSLLASQSTVITDRTGVELYRLFSEEDRTYVKGDDVPLSMKQAVVSIEDERFYERGCLDIKAIARAVLFWGRAGGGSTITRQLARNALNLLHENRYQRKIKEIILGCQLERSEYRNRRQLARVVYLS